MIDWRALLYSPEMLNIPNSEAIINNILEESLSQHMKNLITSSSEKMQAILKLKPKGNLRKRSIENLWIKSNMEIDFETDEKNSKMELKEYV